MKLGAMELFGVITVLLSAAVKISLANSTDSFNLLVLHTNDMHARFEQINDLGGRCSTKNNASCYGGFARLAQTVRDIKSASEDPVIFLNAGDTYQGSVWYSVHKWRVVAHFVEFLGLDVMSLGNHEFDDKVEGLLPFLKNIKIPVVAANLDAELESSLVPYIKPSVVIDINGTTIGVIGYLTPETKVISQLGNVKLFPEVESVAKEAARLKQKGVNILIALGHSGIKTDIKIAELVPDIDLVVGGHTNTFLYTGIPPSTEKPIGDYPLIVTQKSGRKVAVVQAYAFTKYLGSLHLTFNKDGEIIGYKGNPILLDHQKPEDPMILMELEKWSNGVNDLRRKVVGNSRVFLDGTQTSCRHKECNLGNLVTDAMVYSNLEQYSGEGWTDGAIAVMIGGGIRTSIFKEDVVGSITMEDVMTALPFEDAVLLVELAGRHVTQMLELSASFHDPKGQNIGGGFLQLSGLYVRYNMSKPIGNRVMEAKVRCSACTTPILEDINPDKSYFILMPDFIVGGGDGYTLIKENMISSRSSGFTDSDMLASYLLKRSPIIHGIEWRIQIVYGDDDRDVSGADTFVDFPSEPQKNSALTSISQKYILLFSIFIFVKNCML